LVAGAEFSRFTICSQDHWLAGFGGLAAGQATSRYLASVGE
jgi:hypothetical protein